MDAATTKKRLQRFDLKRSLCRIASITDGIRFLAIIPDKQIVWLSQGIAKRINFATTSNQAKYWKNVVLYLQASPKEGGYESVQEQPKERIQRLGR